MNNNIDTIGKNEKKQERELTQNLKETSDNGTIESETIESKTNDIELNYKLTQIILEESTKNAIERFEENQYYSD